MCPHDGDRVANKLCWGMVLGLDHGWCAAEKGVVVEPRGVSNSLDVLELAVKRRLGDEHTEDEADES